MNKVVPVPPTGVTPLGAPRPDKPRLRGRPVVRIRLLGPMQATTYLGDKKAADRRRYLRLAGVAER